MDTASAEKAKARRARRILFLCMGLGIVLPGVLFALLGLRSSP